MHDVMKVMVLNVIEVYMKQIEQCKVLLENILQGHNVGRKS